MFAAWVHFIYTPGVIRNCESVRKRMPTRQVDMDLTIRDLRHRQWWTGAVVVVQAILSIVLWANYLWS
jgi:hypothetical protein